MRSWAKSILATFLFVAGAPVFLRAQSTLGTVRGLVTDATGAVVTGVKIVVRNTETNIARQTVTGNTGNYEVTQLIPGRYEVTAERPGFNKVVIADILLETSATVRADIVMQVGSLATSVQVEAAAPVVNTESAEVAAVRSNQV